ncbi:MAG TPA: VWA domain-containing protein [Blastocatellia bacterium]|nr:VWA domain-containing protein [Blastocatellia bacterium]
MSQVASSIVTALLLWSAQAPLSIRAQDEPIRLKSDLVTLTAAVTDRNGRAIRSLKSADFVVYENGVRQQISHFAATEEPFAVMLLLDLSGSTQDEVDLIKRGARSFLAELRADDRVGVVVFDSKVQVLAEGSGNRASVESAIDGIARSSGTGGQRFTAKTGTSFYDALQAAAGQTTLKQDEGRKAIVCMSDGVDSTSRMLFKDVAPIVEQAEASVYFLELNTEEMTLEGLLKPRTDPGYIQFSSSQVDRFYDQYDAQSMDRFRPREVMSPLVRREVNTGLYEIARAEMRSLAERTGGRVYPVSALTDLRAVYKQVATDLRVQYSISYYPQDRSRDGKWRAIKVETRSPGATVRSRSGYWAPGR